MWRLRGVLSRMKDQARISRRKPLLAQVLAERRLPCLLNALTALVLSLFGTTGHANLVK